MSMTGNGSAVREPCTERRHSWREAASRSLWGQFERGNTHTPVLPGASALAPIFGDNPLPEPFFDPGATNAHLPVWHPFLPSPQLPGRCCAS